MGWLGDLWMRARRPRVAPGEIPAALERVRTHLDAGEMEDGFALLQGVLAAGPQGDDLVEAHALAGELRADAGAWREAHEEFAKALALAPEDGLILGADGEALFNLWEFESAKASLARAVELEPDDATSHRTLALALDRLGDPKGAGKHFRKAVKLDEVSFPLPVRVTRAEFDALARAAIGSLPDWVLQRLNQKISFVAQDYPSLALLGGRAEEADPQTLGLFWGEDLSRAPGSRDQADFVPNQILLFQRNLEQLVGTREALEEEVYTTVFHEVGHYLGYDEEELDRIGLA